MQSCLVVDDSPVICKVARVIIEDLGLSVRIAENGRQAFEQCAADMPDVILLDWQLPVMSAHDFLKALRTYGPSKRPYIIYCTTEIDFVDLQHARAGGAADVLLTPFDRASLSAKFMRFKTLLATRQLVISGPDMPWPREELETIGAVAPVPEPIGPRTF